MHTNQKDFGDRDTFLRQEPDTRPNPTAHDRIRQDDGSTQPKCIWCS